MRERSLTSMIRLKTEMAHKTVNTQKNICVLAKVKSIWYRTTWSTPEKKQAYMKYRILRLVTLVISIPRHLLLCGIVLSSLLSYINYTVPGSQCPH